MYGGRSRTQPERTFQLSDWLKIYRNARNDGRGFATKGIVACQRMGGKAYQRFVENLVNPRVHKITPSRIVKWWR